MGRPEILSTGEEATSPLLGPARKVLLLPMRNSRSRRHVGDEGAPFSVPSDVATLGIDLGKTKENYRLTVELDSLKKNKVRRQVGNQVVSGT